MYYWGISEAYPTYHWVVIWFWREKLPTNRGDAHLRRSLIGDSFAFERLSDHPVVRNSDHENQQDANYRVTHPTPCPNMFIPEPVHSQTPPMQENAVGFGPSFYLLAA